ncbi:hypothetical protein P5673_028198 [Acropora cervicornis]|uniref:E3 ubiquitin-protein ligase APD1-4 middle domain-containing protein n=1 Tax=Acropora cervicornis TaxID=6130 RepID=A0AAD9UVA6_ACRCE|nr:hypothetical protein P5673_028198 [Acropora cervicornis]
MAACASPAEIVYVPENIDGRQYVNYHRFRLRVFICSGMSMLTILSAAIALLILILNVSMPLAQKYDFAEGDMRMISVSTAFCEEISLGGDTFDRKLWILKSLATRPEWQVTNISAEILISKHRYWYKGFYLLKGSAISIKAESDSMLKLFIFKDKTGLNEWIERTDDASHHTSANQRSFKPTRKPTRISYNLKIPESGSYFVLFKFFEEESSYVRFQVDLKIKRIVYDLTSPVYSCIAGAKETCSGKLLFRSSEVGVVEIPQRSSGKSYLSNVIVVTWHCKPRIWFYLAVFVGPILLLSVVCSVFYHLVISRKRMKRIYKLAARRQQVLRSASAAGLNISFGNRSSNGSVTGGGGGGGGPPSRTTSIRTNDNHSISSRAPFQQPVVTTMYTGSPIHGSAESGSDTDEEHEPIDSVENQTQQSSVDGIPLTSLEVTVHRQPSFSTFQSSEDESTVSPYVVKKSRDTKWRTVFDLQKAREKLPRETNTIPRRYSCDELRANDQGDGQLSTNKKARGDCHGERSNSLPRDGRGKMPNGTIPSMSHTRRNSNDELYDRAILEHSSVLHTRDCGNTLPTHTSNDHLRAEKYLVHRRHPSLPVLQCQNDWQRAWAHPLDRSFSSLEASSNDEASCEGQENIVEKQDTKARTHSKRKREIGWSPRLSMVYESEL